MIFCMEIITYNRKENKIYMSVHFLVKFKKLGFLSRIIIYKAIPEKLYISTTA